LQPLLQPPLPGLQQQELLQLPVVPLRALAARAVRVLVTQVRLHLSKLVTRVMKIAAAVEETDGEFGVVVL
jgi:hypothetical protein